MKDYINLEIEAKAKMIKFLEGIESIKIRDKEGNWNVVYVKKGISDKLEGMNDKA